MIRKTLLTLSMLACCSLLAPLITLGAEGHLLLVSLQRSSDEKVCRFYSLDLKTSSITEIRKLLFNPPQEILRVDAYPNQRKAIIWVERPESQEVEAHMLNIDQLAESERVAFPAFGIVSRCYYFDSATSAPVLAVESLAIDSTRNRLDPARNKLYAAFRGAGKGLTEPKELSSLDGRNILLPGVTSSRFGDSQSVSLRYDKVGKKFVEMAGAQIRVEFTVDEKMAALIEKQPTRSSMGIVCNDGRASLIAWGVPAEQNIGERFYLYRKDVGSWKMLVAKGDAGKAQMFDNWIVIQEANYRSATLRQTGEFEICNRDDETSFTWRATTDDTMAQRTEILGMWERDFVYRMGTKLYQADIGNGKVTNERLIFESKEVYGYRIDPIEEIHWVFRMKE